LGNDNRLIEYLFICLAHILRESNQKIQYGTTQYGNPHTGFSITMFHIDHDGYYYAEKCFDILGKASLRECGPTMSVCFNTPEETNAFKNRFMAYMEQAEERLSELNGNAPQEFYALKANPKISEIISTQSNHIVLLKANFHDAIDELAFCEMMKPWTDIESIRDYFEIEDCDDGNAEIRVVFYKLKNQKRFIRYLATLGIGEAS